MEQKIRNAIEVAWLTCVMGNGWEERLKDELVKHILPLFDPARGLTPDDADSEQVCSTCGGESFQSTDEGIGQDCTECNNAG